MTNQPNIRRTDIAKEVRGKLKDEFPECKFSVAIKRYSGVQNMTVSLMTAPFDVFEEGVAKGYAQLNHFALKEQAVERQFNCNGTILTQKGWDTMKRAVEIAQHRNYDNSEPMTDYFDVNYYFHLEIGKWDKSFQLMG